MNVVRSLIEGGSKEGRRIPMAQTETIASVVPAQPRDLTPRTVSESQSEMTELILPNDTNTLGSLLGGRLMHFIDLVGAIAAYRHSRSYVVTAAMDHIDFIQPVNVGDLLILKSSVNRAFSTSMEVGVKVWAENTQAGKYRHVASAYLVFVAIDSQGKRVHVPELVPESEDEHRRFEGAQRRRGNRETESERRRRAKLEPAGVGSVRPGKAEASKRNPEQKIDQR
jgi:acyl-CoA hydrolase